MLSDDERKAIYEDETGTKTDNSQPREETMDAKKLSVIVFGAVALFLLGIYLMFQFLVKPAIPTPEKVVNQMVAIWNAENEKEKKAPGTSELLKALDGVVDVAVENINGYDLGYEVASGVTSRLRYNISSLGGESQRLYDKDKKIVVNYPGGNVSEGADPTTAEPSGLIQEIDNLAKRYGFSVKQTQIPKDVWDAWNAKKAAEANTGADSQTEEGAEEETPAPEEKPAEVKPKAKTKTKSSGNIFDK